MVHALPVVGSFGAGSGDVYQGLVKNSFLPIAESFLALFPILLRHSHGAPPLCFLPPNWANPLRSMIHLRKLPLKQMALPDGSGPAGTAELCAQRPALRF
jgi:hypothetical protein